jgi:tetratricopeptide (TPR) repeat protein
MQVRTSKQPGVRSPITSTSIAVDAVAATWTISFDRLRNEDPGALELLYLLAFLAPDDIDPRLVSSGFTDALQFDRARGALRRYSLIDVSGGSIAVHRLVQAVTRDRLAREGQEQKWAESAVKLVDNAFPFKEDVVETWSPSTRLLPHALACSGHSERLGVALECTVRLLNQVGLYLDNRGQLGGAEQVLRHALAIAEKVYGPDHPKLAIRALGVILMHQGDLVGALQYIQRALAIDEKFYGPDHREVARDANYIGTILKTQGDLAGALHYAQRALAIDEKLYGPDHTDVAVDANNIGQILKDQGDLAGALQYAQRALAIDEKFYGTDHPNVARVVNNVGQILKDRGDLAGALQYTQRALAIDEKCYGPDHPKVATRANNIGRILKEQGDLSGALPYIQRALRICQATYGPGNQLTKIASENLADIEQALAEQAGS